MDPTSSSASVYSPAEERRIRRRILSRKRITSRTLLSKLETVKEALCVCDSTHYCKEKNALTVPTRLLDIGEDGTNNIRVIICSEEIEPAEAPSLAYAALSYCWGTCPAFKSTRSNFAARNRGFAISDMPLTLIDAVRVTRDMGLHYLWVDALCILQDCREDWQLESERMADVYGNAYVTIFAFGARDCEGGLFSPADRKDVSGWQKINFKDQPLNHRAWALQEWHLSPRRLIFTSYDLIFDCLQGPTQDFGHEMYSQRLLPTSILKPQDWDSLVLNYSTRELSNPLDKLPAIAGLARRFDKLSNGLNGRYLSGLWEGHLPCSLLWHRAIFALDLPELSRSEPTVYRAPSWSWASINGAVEFLEASHQTHDRDVMARVFDVESHLAVENDPLGPVVHRLGISSRMKLFEKGSLRETHVGSMTVVIEAYTDTSFQADAEELPWETGRIWGDCVMRPFIDGSRPLRFCGIFVDTVPKDDLVWGLLLLEVNSTTFHRMGCGWCLVTWFADAVECSVVIG